MSDHIVYIIDDDASVLSSVEFLFGSVGIGCRTFGGADAFLMSAPSLSPGCILTDLRMPGLSGLELQAELLRRSFDWPLIFMTGHGDIPTVVKAMKGGATEFVEKPFTEEKLLAAIHSGFVSLKSRRLPGGGSIREAMQQDRIVPHYQPQVDLESGAVRGFEALLRWTPHDAGLDRCKAIHDAFEDPTLGPALSERMLDQIFNDISAWAGEGVDFGCLSINASACDVEDPAYAERLLARIAAAGIPPAAIEVEVAETVTLNPEARIVGDTLEQLSRAGVRIALDDFGTGFASLTHLQNLPVDTIKIDRAFVANLADASSASIVKAIIGLARGLGKQVVGEGVETAAQASFLAEAGCDLGQGYLFGAPLPGSDVPASLGGHNPAFLGARRAPSGRTGARHPAWGSA